MPVRFGTLFKSIASLALILSWAVLLTGCVSAARARAEAHQAYLAGQRDAMIRLRQEPPDLTVTIIGQVNNHVIKWTDGLTLSQGILKAVYTAPMDPTAIIIHRNGQDIPITPDQLLAGKDVRLEPNDVVEIK